MGSLRDRLVWHADHGRVADGPRRYLMMRPDVLMGALASLEPAAQQVFLEAWAASTCRHGGDSLRAYAQAVNHDTAALLAATAAAAADLGWGAWSFVHEDHALHLSVAHSPFVSGWRAASEKAASQPVCAPVRGMLQALAGWVLGGEVAVRESACLAQLATGAESTQGGGCAVSACRFTARRPS